MVLEIYCGYSELLWQPLKMDGFTTAVIRLRPCDEEIPSGRILHSRDNGAANISYEGFTIPFRESVALHWRVAAGPSWRPRGPVFNVQARAHEIQPT